MLRYSNGIYRNEREEKNILKIYKDLKIAYFFFAIVGALGIILAMSALDYEWTINLLILLMAVVWMIGCAFIFIFKAIKRANKNKELYSNCRIKEYVAENERWLSKARGKVAIEFFKMNLVVGYYALGDLQKAKDCLFSIHPDFPDNSYSVNANFSFYSNLCTYYLEIGELDKAKAAFDSMKMALESPLLKDVHRNIIVRSWINKSVLLDIHLGKFDGAEKCMLLALETEKSLFTQISIHRSLSLIYLHYGKAEEAKSSMNFIIENGGDTFYVTWAKNQLRQLETAGLHSSK